MGLYVIGPPPRWKVLARDDDHRADTLLISTRGLGGTSKSCYIGASRGEREDRQDRGCGAGSTSQGPGERRRTTAVGTSVVGSNPGLAPMVAMGEETAFVLARRSRSRSRAGLTLSVSM